MLKFLTLTCLLASSSTLAMSPHHRQPRQFFGQELSSNSLLGDIPLVRTDGPVDPPADDDIICVQKVMQVERTEYDEEERCTHVTSNECHLTYVTKQVQVEQEECEEEFVKTCNIEVVERPFTRAIEICNQPLKRDCDLEGEVVCTEETVTVCSTDYIEKTVTEDIPQCTTEFVEVCDKDADGNELSGPEYCSKVPRQSCVNMEMEVRRLSGEPTCRPTRQTVCGPEQCPLVQGEKACHMEDRTEVKKELEEQCRVTPNTVCRMVQVPLPVLEEKEECLDVPKEICANVQVNPRTITTPTIKEWCGSASLVGGIEGTTPVDNGDNDAGPPPPPSPPSEPFRSAGSPALVAPVKKPQAQSAQVKRQRDGDQPTVTTFSQEALDLLVQQANAKEEASKEEEEKKEAREYNLRKKGARNAKIWRQ